MMPVPQGQITSSELWNTPEVVEEPKEEVVAEDYVPYVEPAWSGSTGWQV